MQEFDFNKKFGRSYKLAFTQKQPIVLTGL